LTYAIKRIVKLQLFFSLIKAQHSV
jgi:hypothetical protein